MTECEPVRESLSALMDREWPTLGREEVLAHLSECPDCRRWRDRAHEATRQTRAAVPQPPPALADSLLAALGGRRWSPWTLPVRVLLGLVGWGIAAFALPALVYGLDAEAPPHVAHEMGSLNVAIGLALALVALRPERARGVLPLFGVVVGLLVLTAGDDVVSGRTSWGHEAPHALVVAGFVLLLALVRLGRVPSRPDPLGRGRLTAATSLTSRRRSAQAGQVGQVGRALPRKRAI